MKELIKLKNDLESAKQNAFAIVENGRWMRSIPALHLFGECLSLHYEINRLLQKGISRVQAQNVTRSGGRF